MQNIRIRNPLQINDWPIAGFLKVILGIQFAVWLVIGLDVLGWQIPGLRQVVVLIYLSYVPGIIILRILRLHKLGKVETLLYSVGLSVAAVMFTGLLMNACYPLFGISRPISVIPLVITISILVLTLCVVSYIRDRDFADTEYFNVSNVLSPQVLLLCCIPFISVVGTYLVNFYHNNILLLFLIVVIIMVVFLAGINKYFHKDLYPWIILVIAISLVFYRSLLTMYISGTDIHGEYYYSNLVIKNGVWNAELSSAYNSVLSVIMLAPITSIICSIDLTWVYKLLYPLLLALAALGLFRLFQKQTDARIAFLGSFFFMATVNFYTDLPTMMRQVVATFFLVLLVLMVVEKNIAGVKRFFLLIIFSVSLVVSHYGLSYIVMLCFLGAWFIFVLDLHVLPRKLIDIYHSRFQKRKSYRTESISSSSSRVYKVISLIFVIIFAALAYAWYTSVSGSIMVHHMTSYLRQILGSIPTDLYVGPAETTKQLVTGNLPATPMESLFILIRFPTRMAVYLFIVTGFFVVWFKQKEFKFSNEFFYLTIPMLIIYLGTIQLPFFKPVLSVPQFDLGRFAHMTLVFLSVYFVIGGMWVIRIVCRAVKLSRMDVMQRLSFALLCLFAVLYFSIQIQLLHVVTGMGGWSYSLTQERIKEEGTLLDKVHLYNSLTPEQEVFSAEWLSGYMKPEEKIYATYSDSRVHTLTSYGMVPIPNVVVLTASTQAMEKDAYVYLQYVNIVEGIGTELDRTRPWPHHVVIYSIDEIRPLWEDKNRIYSNGGSEVYR